MGIVDMRHARQLQELAQSGATVEDMARAYASIDGRRDEFDEGRDISVFDDNTGHYAGYTSEMERIIKRATKYARERSQRSE